MKYFINCLILLIDATIAASILLSCSSDKNKLNYVGADGIKITFSKIDTVDLGGKLIRRFFIKNKVNTFYKILIKNKNICKACLSANDSIISAYSVYRKDNKSNYFIETFSLEGFSKDSSGCLDAGTDKIFYLGFPSRKNTNSYKIMLPINIQGSEREIEFLIENKKI